MHKFSSLFLLTSLALPQVWADSSQDSSPSAMDQKQTVVNPLTQMGVNLAARPVINGGANLFLNGEVLYWQAIEDNINQVSQSFGGSTFQGNPTLRKLVNMDFDWDCGFRAIFGYNAPRDGWDISLGWTSIRNRATSYAQMSSTPNTNQSQSLFQSWGDSNHRMPDGIFSSRARMHIALDQIDFQWGRECYFGERLTLRPYVGARNAWINQDFSIFVQNTVASASSQLCKFHNDFWGVGLVGGINTDWKFGRGLSLYSVSDLSILLGFFDVKEKIFFGIAPSDIAPQKTNIPSVSELTDPSLQSSWKTSFRKAVPVFGSCSWV